MPLFLIFLIIAIILLVVSIVEGFMLYKSGIGFFEAWGKLFSKEKK